MSDSQSYTDSYSAADVNKVADRFGSDLEMIGQSTGVLGESRKAGIVNDVKELAKKGYLEQISVVLFDSAGGEVKARKYVVSTDASLWTSDRPGDNLWPRTPGGSLKVVVHYTDAWAALGEAGQTRFESGLKLSWSASQVDTNFPGLSGTAGRRYASNAFGLERTDYS
jgi:Bacterial HORMA domain family 1